MKKCPEIRFHMTEIPDYSTICSEAHSLLKRRSYGFRYHHGSNISGYRKSVLLFLSNLPCRTPFCLYPKIPALFCG